MHVLSVYLLGSPTVKRQNQHLNIQRRKGMALLAYLVVTAQPHSRDALAAMLWPEYDQSSARANLRRDLSRLKDEVGQEILIIDWEQVSLNPQASVWLDMAEFTRRVARAREHGHFLRPNAPPLCSDCQSLLEEAVELYRGDFMEGFGLPDSPQFDEWQYFQSDSLRQKLGEALQHLVRWHELRHEYALAIEYARRWLALDTLHEPAHRQLMLLYALDGQQAAALRQYELCQRTLAEELGVEPESETTQLNENIRQRKIGPSQEAPAWWEASPQIESEQTNEEKPEAADHKFEPAATPGPRRKHNLPAQLTAFVGRKRELEDIERLLLEDPNCRLLTLLGPGGSGKTRLALQAGRSAIDGEHGRALLSDGVWFVPLAPLTDPASIASAIAKELELSLPSDQAQPRQQLLRDLRPRRSLLILDNFEHLLDEHSAGLLSEILAAAPHIKILVTTRVRLNIQEEHLFPVAGLNIPPAGLAASLGAASTSFSALDLFRQSAARVSPGFQITAENFSTVADICQQVQGMPLAIELAAAWLEMLSVEEVSAEIRNSLDFLEADWHDLPERQQSLRAVFNSSLKLLSETARPAIQALAVFRGGFTRQAAQAVAGASKKLLLELMNKSWLQRQPDGRFAIHELLRQFALEKLESHPAVFEQIQQNYGEYYIERAQILWGQMRGRDQRAAMQEVADEFENLRTAWNWLVEQSRFEEAIQNLLHAIFLYAETRNEAPEMLRMVDLALGRLEETEPRQENDRWKAILLTVQSAYYQNGFPVRFESFGMVLQGRLDTLKSAWTYAGGEAGVREMGFWGIVLAYLYGRIIDVDAGRRVLHAMLPDLRRDARHWELAAALLHLAMLVLTDFARLQEREQTDAYLQEALVNFELAGDEISRGQTLRQRGNLRYQEQKLEQAIEHWQEAIEVLEAAGEWIIAADIRWQMGDTFLQLGQFQRSFEIYREGKRIYLEKGFLSRAASITLGEVEREVRYGDLQMAMESAHWALEKNRQVGDEQAMAWCMWWIGNIHRIRGEQAEALHWFERAHVEFKKIQEFPGITFYHYALGEIALAAEKDRSAFEQFSAAVEAAQEIHNDWISAFALSGLARAEVSSGQLQAARKHLLDALRLANQNHERGLASLALDTLSVYFAAAGQRQKAAALAEWVAEYFASWKEIQQQAKARFEALSAELPAGNAAPLLMGQGGREIWELLERSIEELEKSG